MKEIFKRFTTYRNILGLMYIIFYFSYIGINMYRNKGNFNINVILLILTCVYLVFYIYSVFIEENKRIRKGAKHFFSRGKKFLGFANVIMIFTSLLSNDSNSFFTIFFAVVALFWYLLYFVVDIGASLALREVKKFKKELGWKSNSSK